MVLLDPILGIAGGAIISDISTGTPAMPPIGEEGRVNFEDYSSFIIPTTCSANGSEEVNAGETAFSTWVERGPGSMMKSFSSSAARVSINCALIPGSFPGRRSALMNPTPSASASRKKPFRVVFVNSFYAIALK